MHGTQASLGRPFCPITIGRRGCLFPNGEAMKVYRIKDWERHYECNRTREMKEMKWVPVPVKHDGLGYCRLVGRKNGAANLGAWLAILQVAAKSNPRGTLLRDSRTPLRADDIAMMTRLPVEIISETIALCCSEGIGWMETIGNEANPQEPAEKPQEGAVYLPLQGIEGKDNTGKDNIPPLPPKGEGGRDRGHLKESEKKRMKVKENTPMMVLIGSWFKRQADTLWTVYEQEALKQVNPIEPEVELMGKYYTSEEIYRDDFRRRDIATLLNNWNTELDRARKFLEKQERGY